MKIAATRALLLAVVGFLLALSGCSEKPADDTKAAESVAETPIAATAPALVQAAGRGDLTEIRALLDAGAEIDVTDALGRTPLHMAAFYGNPKTSALLIARGANIEARDRIG
ncbi:MAG: ankyrin repeat domain-containing protein, partial [Candidatus Accumulibacter sp.]|nr:ankyrin repeat domain-containing protein [Accumulibacter sp.]